MRRSPHIEAGCRPPASHSLEFEMSSNFRDLFVPASDGLCLYARDYGPVTGNALPVVCLPGLARNSEDFHALAEALSTDPSRPRRVLALDYRGRGRSEWDP